MKKLKRLANKIKRKRRELHFEEAIIDIIKDNNGNSKLVIEVIDDEYFNSTTINTEISINHFRIQDWRRKAIEGELVAHSNMEIEERQLIK